MKPEEIEKEREEFEAWYMKTYSSTPWRGHTFDRWPTNVYELKHVQDGWSDDVYKLQHVQDGWQAWIARAELSMKGNQNET